MSGVFLLPGSPRENVSHQLGIGPADQAEAASAI